jgi:hypothetical protein
LERHGAHRLAVALGGSATPGFDGDPRGFIQAGRSTAADNRDLVDAAGLIELDSEANFPLLTLALGQRWVLGR